MQPLQVFRIVTSATVGLIALLWVIASIVPYGTTATSPTPATAPTVTLIIVFEPPPVQPALADGSQSWCVSAWQLTLKALADRDYCSTELEQEMFHAFTQLYECDLGRQPIGTTLFPPSPSGDEPQVVTTEN